MLLSVVVPIYFEEDSIEEFYKRIKRVLDGLALGLRHEIIFVDDGSADRSGEMLDGLSRNDDAVKIITFSRNFGHQTAITAGIDHASGDAVVVIDADLQDPPEIIPEMVEKWRSGYKVVYGVRSMRRGESAFKRLTAKVFYRSLNKLSDVELPLDTGDFRLMDRAVVDVLCSIREGNRYIRGLIGWIGFRQCGLSYERDSRYAGVTKFSLGRMIRFALDGITGFSDKPLHLSGQIGLLITIMSFIMMTWLIISKLINPESSIQGWTSVLVVVLFMGGVQLISVGLLGEYIARIHRETKHRPLYVVAKKAGFADNRTGCTISEVAKTVVPGTDILMSREDS